MYKPTNCPHCGKIISANVLKGETKRTVVICPECSSRNNCKNGFRKTDLGKVQTYLCRNCGRRFSEPLVPKKTL